MAFEVRPWAPGLVASGFCWEECRQMGLYCPEFCCQPHDSIGNPTCWDVNGFYTYDKCCSAFAAPTEPTRPPKLKIGSVELELYRGPVTHNTPRFNERTVEVALGLWFIRRCVSRIREAGEHNYPLEVGNVLASYFPRSERIEGRYLPWSVVDVGDNGIDVTEFSSFSGSRVLSISTVEHIGYDNEGVGREKQRWEARIQRPGLLGKFMGRRSGLHSTLAQGNSRVSGHFPYWL
eukprot:TRINITY_DN45804_c0_g1_i1.p1 TRINITY_DN45804_c0_g1~~TRINITY_DN45804_c0_g1_i1.p1  ORF type:complete len:234 (-),score=3.43 TRINITY_DN45804_c0_g1_i1:350-1051(-)